MTDDLDLWLHGITDVSEPCPDQEAAVGGTGASGRLLCCISVFPSTQPLPESELRNRMC